MSHAAPESTAPRSKPKIAVLMGGKSAEREVSLVTGEQIAKALEQKGYEVLRVDLDDSFVGTLTTSAVDAVFIALHGRLGEDGTVQGMLDVLGIPYTGSGVLASALAMDKVASKKIFSYEGIPTPEFAAIRRDQRADAEEIMSRIGLPLVVKPSREGSAIGVSIVREEDDLAGALDEAFALDDEVLLERYVAGTEITVGVIEDPTTRALPTLEVVPANEMYDYESKYTPGMSEHIIPARIPEQAQQLSQELAVRAHRALGCSGFSRVDLIVEPDGKACVLEVNTIPGMTGTSLFPEAARAVGIEFPDLVERLALQAVQPRGTAKR